MKKIFILGFIVLTSVFSKAQSSLPGFPVDFGPDLISVPSLSNVVGWTTTVTGAGEIVLEEVDPATGGAWASFGGGNALLLANSNVGLQTVQYGTVSTQGWGNVQINWEQLNNTGAGSTPIVTAEYSGDGITWFNIPYVNNPNDDIFYFNFSNFAGGEMDNQTSLYIRFQYTGNSANEYVAIDNVNIVGDPTPIFYWNGGALDLTTSWDLLAPFSGLNPPNFTNDFNQFYLYPPISTATLASLTASWSLSGVNSSLFVGDGAGPFNLELTAGNTFSLSNNFVTRVSNQATLTLLNSTFPSGTNFSFQSGSTVDYAQLGPGSVTVNATTYHNLTISTPTAVQSSGVVIVDGDLSLTGNFLMTGSPASTSNLNLRGTISGSGLLLTRTNSRLLLGNTGALGTLNFGNGGTNLSLSLLNINRTSATGSAILGTNLTVTGSSNFVNGNLDLNGRLLTLNGIISFTGGVSSFGGSNSSSLTIGGSGNISGSFNMDQTNPATRSMDQILMSRTSRTLTLGNALDIYGSITPSIGTIAAGTGNLTIKSNASTIGRVGPLSPTGFLTGSPTVEVFRPALVTDWVNLCTGGVNGNTFSGWNSSFAMTCATCPSGTGGAGITASVYSYNEVLAAGNSANPAAYIDIDSFGGYTSAINSNSGYYVYLGTSSPGSVGSAITIPLTGPINTKNLGGNITITRTGANPTEDGWNLIANPYPSALVASAVIATMGANINAASLQSYNPATGGYVNYSGSATIPMGQAFFVQSAVASANIVPSETWKVTTNDNTNILKTASTSGFYFDDFLLNLTSNVTPGPFFTQAYFTFGSNYTTNYESGDCLSFEGTYATTPRITAFVNSKMLARTAYPSLSGLTTIAVIVKTGFAGVYSINPVNINLLPAGACVTLFDVENNVSHDLKTGAYTTTIAAGATSPQFELRINVIPASLISNYNNPVCKKTSNGLLVAKGTSAGPWNYTWKDINNTIIKISNNILSFDSLKNVAEGTYYVDVNTVGSCDNANTQFVLNATTPLPTALFTANATTVAANANVPVSFTNNSINANNYFWNFDDGTTANTANTSHLFTNEGIYNVKLIATNGACADSSSTSTQVEAIAGSIVGIKSNKTDNGYFVSKDENGVFVQLNFDVFTKTEISITNILGQIITAKKIVVVDKNKYYLSVPENEKIIFVTIEANNNKQTVKIIN